MEQQTIKPVYSTVGVIGAGSFGMTIANLLAANVETVLIFSRREEVVKAINETHVRKGYRLHENVVATSNLEEIAQRCALIFPIIPSENFRELMRQFSKHLQPYHLLIHGTKGLDSEYLRDLKGLSGRTHIHTMSEVIRQETAVVRIGCLSGPNLSAEIMAGQPAATVIASNFQEVIHAGKQVLRGNRFQVYSTEDIIGAEIAGALKNTIAIGAGILDGMGMGYNIWALLVTKGLAEMIHFGKALGAEVKPFLGVAGIGDLVATASSTKSRNYTVGFRLAKGESLSDIRKDMDELAEGVHTIKIIKKLANYYKINAPISDMIYRVLYEDFDIERAINYLINYRYSVDVDYI